ncbi:uncharacterized protein LOC141664157 [Apium graveolens]|uniref:uncharacterized protein LOC141664157 n=1 Tax=Apium graveolens TaxID=4045 RepID=UPI003D799148
MESRMKKRARMIPEHEGEDRISRLPDDLIHRIYSFLDAKEAVQSSVLSTRWKLIWTTLPSVAFGQYGESDACLPFYNTSRYAMFIRHVLTNRNHQSYLSELKMHVPRKLTVQQSVSRKKFRGCVVEKFIQYAILHNVECLNISLGYRHKFFKLSAFSSKSLKNLTLGNVQLEICKEESDCWVLPALTSLHLKNEYYHLYNYRDVNHKVPESWLTSLPALKSLYLDFWDLKEMRLSLPDLTSIRLERCRLPETVLDVPALLTLHLDTYSLTKNVSDMFSTLASLRNLTLILGKVSMQRDHIISCPQLLNLKITTYCHAPHGNIVVSAPLLCNFSSSGLFSIKFEVQELENVDIKLKDWFSYVGCEYMEYYQRFTCMLSGLGAANNLSFDLESIKALAKNSDSLASISSPFYNLKCVKLPKECRASTIPSALKSYLLSGSPGATIVTSLPRKNMIPQTQAISVTTENVVLPEPLAAPTKELGDCQCINETVEVDTVNMEVQEQHVMENSLVDANRARQTVTPVEGVSKDFGLWQGHEVNSEFVCLLNRIMHKYPETFEHFTTKNKKFGTMNLNMLCTSLNDFTKIPLMEVNSEMIVEYRDVFAYLQNQGFNVSWLVNRLNYIEHLRFSKPLIPELHAIDCHIDDAKSKLQDLQALRVVKMTEIQNAFGTMGTNLAAGFIGDDLLSGP